MAELNDEHMGKSGPTDVLSFPLDDLTTRSGAGVPTLLGDIVISPRSPPRSSPNTPARSTTRSRCWSSTGSCTSSATITPSPTRRR